MAPKNITEAKPIQATLTVKTSPTDSGRKPWKKRTPVDVVRDQIERLRKDVEVKDAELALAKRQLLKLEEAVKVLDA